jgi:ribose 1,5-bisphosphokinase
MRQARLFYLIGASGAGKDSLLAAARRAVPVDAPLAFAHRYITRPADAGGENHVALSEAEFQHRLAHGCFAMHWHSHGLHYGIGREIEQWLAAGLDVVVNGSRGFLNEAQARFPQLNPLWVRVSEQRLRERLLTRGRESAAAIEQRLHQARELDAALAGQPLRRIDNNGSPAVATAQLLGILLEDSPCN